MELTVIHTVETTQTKAALPFQSPDPLQAFPSIIMYIIAGRSSEREKKLLESVVRDNEIMLTAVMICDVINTHKRQWQS